ncbi:MAG: helix-turn-helix domain-containing protein [Defluviitaleaceae bacterium]|nr:helix-turn-helix domain-containing protein [Defluviitaleaceae bacterium]
MTLGEKIQVLRKQSGMSQDLLSAKILVTRQAVSKWELGESMPDVDNIVQLSRIFNVTTDYLLKNETVVNPTAPPLIPDPTQHEAEAAISLPLPESTAKRTLWSPMIIGIIGMVFVGLNILRRNHEMSLFTLAGSVIMIGIIIAFIPKEKTSTDTVFRLGKLMTDSGIIAIIASGIFFTNSQARTILLYANIIAWLGLVVTGVRILFYFHQKYKWPFIEKIMGADPFCEKPKSN